MKKRTFLVAIGLILGGMYAGSAIVGAQAPGDGDDPQAGRTPDQMAMTPGDAHKHLDYFVGKWKTKTKIYMGGPGSPPMESDGQSSMKWVLDGRFIMHEHKGTMMGQPYEGIGMTGYDNYRNLYISSWCSNMGTNMLTFAGMRHPETGVFTYYGEMDEPSMNVIGRTVKYVTRIVDADHYTFEIIDLHAGDDYKVIELSYERVK
ncbi:MAG: DUF1579 domain-containing protein [Planctomycetes bacterium]|nr:DUF1579 domain-containing protein [Planctomycetota bacterium]